MPVTVKVLLTAAVVCLLIWGIGVLHVVHPLAVDRQSAVIYGEGEDFWSDAVVYRNRMNANLRYLRLPHARQGLQWMTIDFERSAIYAAGRARSVASLIYVLRDDSPGEPIADRTGSGEWRVRFTPEGVSFAGDGFTCMLRMARR